MAYHDPRHGLNDSVRVRSQGRDDDIAASRSLELAGPICGGCYDAVDRLQEEEQIRRPGVRPGRHLCVPSMTDSSEVKVLYPELALEPEAKGEARSDGDQGTEARMARAESESPAAGRGPSMEMVVEPGNLRKALARVRRNKGAPGLDGMTVEKLGAHLKDHWPETKSRLLDGTYEPQPVRRVEIPKASVGVRPLGVPTVLDRFIQQAVMQVLQGDWDGSFSDASYGFRPGCSAHQAVERAQEYIGAGFGIVVDLELEKFFDRVNHDVLMGLVVKRVADKRKRPK